MVNDTIEMRFFQIDIFIFVILSLLGAVVFFILAIVVYAHILMRKRPLTALYDARSRQEDFCHYEDIPPMFIHFILQVEDDCFFEHKGLAWLGIRDAVMLNIRNRKIVTGGSTISQQLVKNLYFRFHHSFIRKACETIITCKLERIFSKQKILEMYLNIIYWGFGIYGIKDAAAFYFGKEPADLTVNQMFILACIPFAPTMGNPISFPDRFERIRNKRLDLLMKRGTISEADAKEIRSHDMNGLDPLLRKADPFTDNYSRKIPLNNDRFGPYPNENGGTRP